MAPTGITVLHCARFRRQRAARLCSSIAGTIGRQITEDTCGFAGAALHLMPGGPWDSKQGRHSSASLKFLPGSGPMDVAYAPGASWLAEQQRNDARNIIETLGNLLYLINVDAEIPARVRSYVG